MSAVVIDGVTIAKSVRADCQVRVFRLLQRGGARPGLAVLKVGDDPASAIYIRNKVKFGILPDKRVGVCRCLPTDARRRRRIRSSRTKSQRAQTHVALHPSQEDK
jgi:hypothetical protein